MLNVSMTPLRAAALLVSAIRFCSLSNEALFDLSAVSEKQQAWIKTAISRCTFDFTLLASNLLQRTGRSAISVRLKELDSDTFAIAYQNGSIEIDSSLNEEETVQSFLSEAAHMVDFFYLTEEMRNRIIDVYVLENNLAVRPVWWAPKLVGETYYTQIGESFMAGFTKAFSDVLIGDQEFVVRSTPLVLETIREVLEPIRMAASKPETAIHDVADRHYHKVLTTIQYAFAIARKAVRGVDKSKAADVAAKAVHAAIVDVLPKVLIQLAVDAAKLTWSEIPKLKASEEFRAAKPATVKPGIKIRFDVTDPRAVAWAREHVSKIADDIADTTKKDINEVVGDFIEDGDFDDLYDLILKKVGDEARADMIARTEIMTAANEGQRQAWEEAVDEGLLPSGTERVWIATEVGACPICEELDGQTADLDGEYPGGYSGPPAHPNCRCTEGIRG